MKGDEITIVEVRGTADTIMPGNIYWIKGTYTLASHDRAMLAAFTTARDAADGTGPSLKVQTTVVTRGTGTFTLFLPVSCRGSPHVSFYAADGGEDFGGSYFGTGDSVLKQWWGAKGGSAQENGLPAAKEKPTANPPASTPAAGNDVSKQLLAEFRRAYALPDDKVVKRVALARFTGADGILSRPRRRAGKSHPVLNQKKNFRHEYSVPVKESPSDDPAVYRQPTTSLYEEDSAVRITCSAIG